MSKHTETGMGKGNGPHADKQVHNADELAEKVVDRIVSGGAISAPSRTGPITDPDRKLLARIAQESAEDFNERVALKLRTIGDKVLAKIDEKLDQDAFKTSELAFVYSVAHDKRLALDGSRALQTAQINQQINVFTDKASLLSELDGMLGLKNVTPP